MKLFFILWNALNSLLIFYLWRFIDADSLELWYHVNWLIDQY